MELFDFLRKIVEVFEDLGIPYLVTGLVASMAYGEPRLTNDIDIVAQIFEQHIPRSRRLSRVTSFISMKR